MNKMDKFLMVVPREKIFPEGVFHGFKSHSEENLYDLILNNHEYRRRGDMEIDPSFQQPIPYCVIVNENNHIFAYQREQQTEKRLMGMRSIGLGGHVDDDHKDDENPIDTSMMRELEEELGITNPIHIELIGYIKDDTNDVGKVHIGLLHVVKVNTQDIEIKEETMNGKFLSPEEFEKIINEQEVETRSRFAFDPMRYYLQ